MLFPKWSKGGYSVDTKATDQLVHGHLSHYTRGERNGGRAAGSGEALLAHRKPSAIACNGLVFFGRMATIREFLYIPDAFLFPPEFVLSDLADIKRAEQDGEPSSYAR